MADVELAEPGVAEAIDLGWHSSRAPSVVRIREDNPGMFTGPGTNTFLVGDSSVWVLDPGEDRDDGHRDAILEAIGDRSVEGVLISHGHRDHWPLGVRLAQEWGVATYGFGQSAGDFEPDETLVDQQVLAGDGFELLCLHTPGHCADHLSFAISPTASPRPEPTTIFCADHVMAWSSTVLAPPDGSLTQYLESIDKLIALDPAQLLPAHGPKIGRPVKRMELLRDHRLQRTQQLLTVLTDQSLSLEEAVKRIYTDLNPELLGAAAASLSAHVDALIEEGRIQRRDDQLKLV